MNSAQITALGGDQGILARTLWGEARGDGNIGMQAVACVIMNRCAIGKAYQLKHGHPHPLYGDGSPSGVCLAPWQFSAWNSGDPNRSKMIAVTAESDPIFIQALDIAADAINGRLIDPTGGATSYKTTALPWPKAWGDQVAPTAIIGHQSFYRLS